MESWPVRMKSKRLRREFGDKNQNRRPGNSAELGRTRRSKTIHDAARSNRSRRRLHRHRASHYRACAATRSRGEDSGRADSTECLSCRAKSRQPVELPELSMQRDSSTSLIDSARNDRAAICRDWTFIMTTARTRRR